MKRSRSRDDGEFRQLAVGGVQDDGGGRFVDLAAPAGGASFDQVEPPDAVRAGNRSQADDQVDERHRDAVDRDRRAPLERQLHVGRFVGAFRSSLRQRVEVLGRLAPRVVDSRAIDRAAPQVRVDGQDLAAVRRAAARSRRDPGWPRGWSRSTRTARRSPELPPCATDGGVLDGGDRRPACAR